MSRAGWQNVSVTLGGKTRLDALTADLLPESFTALIGPNGAGKSTALKALAGVINVTSGELKIPEGSPGLAYLPQARSVAWTLTSKDLVAIGLSAGRHLFRQFDEAGQTRILEGLVRADASHLADRIVQQLSGGEQARIHLARLFASHAPLLILDEPLAGLDPGHQFDLMQRLKDEARNGRTVIIAMHDLMLAEKFADRLIVLNKGRMAADLSDAFLPNQVLADVFRLQRKSGTLFGPV
ncbi:MAG: ABC transporter ATP-binding protein [Pseudomonadota bacterium]